jgi:uncharacterized alkaline shock family protein YloU
MSDVVNSIFGRSKYETSGPGGYVAPDSTTESDAADVAASPETVDIEAIEVGQTETAEDRSTDNDEDTADAVEANTDDQAEDAADEAASNEDVAEASDETVAEEDTDAEVVGEVPVVAAAEPATEPEEAGTRPAAGTRGSTTVADGVVTKIVTMVARKAEGVHELDEAGTSVDVDGEVATIAVTLVVVYGHPVKKLAEQLRIDVIEAVEDYLGLDVALVDVHIADIHVPDAG